MCAVIKRGILGGVQNKIGNVVGSSWKGIAVLRSLPLSVANPRTSGQVAQRTVFKLASVLGSALLATVVKPMWDRFAQRESGFNAFVRANISAFYANGTSDLSMVEISKGTLAPSLITSAVYNSGTKKLTIAFETAPVGDANPNDVAFIAVLQLDAGNILETAIGFSSVVDRSVGTAVIDLEINDPATFATNVYLGFRKADGTRVSNTSLLTVS